MTDDTCFSVRVGTDDFDAGAEMAALREGQHGIGALVSFVGCVRDLHEGATVGAMTLEHYPGMTEKSLIAIVSEARQRWSLQGVRIVHRVGRLLAGDQIVLVIAASAHRQDAFDACAFLMDYLKTRAPFWKHEETDQGARWVTARDSDDEAARRWQARD